MKRSFLVALAAFIVGGMVATVATFLMFKWELICNVDRSLVWAALGALGTICTGAGAVYASFRAVDIARRQADYVVKKGSARATIIAALVRGELVSAASQMEVAKIMVDSKVDSRSFLKLLAMMSIAEPKLGLEFALDLDAHPGGATIAQAIADIRSAGGMVEGIKKMGGFDGTDAFETTITAARTLLTKTVREANANIAAALSLLQTEE